MFEKTDHARIFACPPGTEFPRALVEGMRTRLASYPPDAMARVEIYVNTRRMQRRIFQLFDDGPACLMPNVRLVTDLAGDPSAKILQPAISPLRRRLELGQLIAGLLDKQSDLAPRSAIFDLADSLALLMAEMHDEGVSPDTLGKLDVTDRSGHWQRSQKFLQIVSRYFGGDSGELPDQECRQRQVIEALVANWKAKAPTHPVIVAGSTGSRGTTALLMQAVARLPQGAVILPGFDFELPDAVWHSLDDALTGEGHPQFRLRRVMQSASLEPRDIQHWSPEVAPPSRARNRLVSLALRPAPVTSQWLTEGPKLRNIDAATRDMALIEAPSERIEALTIALALRQAAEDGKTAALVTPDKMLTRRVRAALDRWRIEPDFSVGEPLAQSAPGRLLRHVASLIGAQVSAEALIVLLKHPLVSAANPERGAHLTCTRDLELHFRHGGPPFPTSRDILQWAEKDPERTKWANWISEAVFGLGSVENRRVTEHFEQHLAIAALLVAGPNKIGTEALWQGAAGKEARRVVAELGHESAHAGTLSPRDYAALFHAVLKRGEVRDPVRPHPNIMIWGTLEARVQGADLVILGGLNDGTWPGHATPDPWLNREMRHQAGLLVPERRIGLSAHDFQQAIAAKEVILTRSLRGDHAQTVPSRWLNRLTNLMGGMSDNGRQAIKNIRANGQVWLDIAATLEAPTPVDAAPRPCPMPPVAARPRALSVTAISTLIRDPYAIYARHVLGLKPLESLRRAPDARLRGTVIHKIAEDFIRSYARGIEPTENRARLLRIADLYLEKHAPWPLTRILWRARFERVVDGFLQDEIARAVTGEPVGLEVPGSLSLPEADFKLTGKADRLDRSESGGFLIYDYKTGALPSKTALQFFDKQLWLEAVMAENGAFRDLDSAPVESVGHIGLGSSPAFKPVPVQSGEVQQIRDQLLILILHYQKRKQGYASRRAMSNVSYDGDYDHLARFGEWDETQTPTDTPVGI